LGYCFVIHNVKCELQFVASIRRSPNLGRMCPNHIDTPSVAGGLVAGPHESDEHTELRVWMGPGAPNGACCGATIATGALRAGRRMSPTMPEGRGRGGPLALKSNQYGRCPLALPAPPQTRQLCDAKMAAVLPKARPGALE